MDDVARLLLRGVLPAKRLQEELGASPATLMRRVRHAGLDVLRIGRGRATRYGLRQAWPGHDGSRFSLVRIDERGDAQAEGELVTLAGGQTVVVPVGDVHTGLPIELADNRPSGFLGRHFATRYPELRLPLRLEDWSDNHALLVLSRRGEDLTGNLLVGDESFARWQSLVPLMVDRRDYPALAEASIAGHPPGSSAGGERPKFGAFVEGRHVLVKFAARGSTGDVVARRWCDLLVLEALALDVISSRGVPAARAQVVETDAHTFLEVERFDRVGQRGRRAVLSLAALHDDLSDGWARAALRLREARHVTVEDADRLRWLDAFGALIANTDRHQFNVVFFPDLPHARLAPAFDQVSMRYAPTADGQVRDRQFPEPAAIAEWLDVWDDARATAREFWSRASDDGRLTDGLRQAAADHARRHTA
ncbi:MAG: transcriptional regulator [Acidobacteria bacterium]|nr:transcriptional regulator [Acidobacteriota bacterium]